MKRAVFISHSSKDKAIGHEVCRFLEANGISCWIAPRDVTPGKNYGAAILDAIDECSVFVLILTSESNKSSQVVREVERAASTDSIIIPFRVEEVQPSRNLEFYVSAAHWLDAVTKPLDKHLYELAEAIANWQSSGLPEREHEHAATAPLAQAPRSRRKSFGPALIVMGALVAGVILYGILDTLLRHHHHSSSVDQKAVSSPSPPKPPAENSPSSSPLVAPSLQPSASAPVTFPPPIASASPAETASSSSPQGPVGRMRSAESIRSATTPVIDQVTASSELKTEHQSYPANLAVDGNPATAWAPRGDGIGESLTVHFKSPVTITSVSILGGFGQDHAHYHLHNRVRTLRVTLSDGATQTLNFEDKMKMQRFDLEHSGTAEWVKFEILAVYRGTERDSTPISEIAFNRDAD